MRIDFTRFALEPSDSGKTGRAGETGRASSSESAATEARGKSAPATDDTELSSDQTRVQAFQAQVLAEPEIRGAKVQALQDAIGKGEYSVSAGQIADALFGEYSAAPA